MRSPLASIRDPNGALYFHVRIINHYGQEEDWFLTDGEVERIRDRAARKVVLALAAPEIPAWKRTIFRWLGA